MKTKAAILYEQNKPLLIEEVEIPELRNGQVLVRMLCSGVCHTQLHEIKGEKGYDPYLPHLLGHEGSGLIEEVGEGVTKVKKGDYVAMTWMQGKGINAQGSKYKIGDKEINSGAITTFSYMAVVSENRLVKIDKKTPPDIAALLGCAVSTGVGMIENYFDEDKNKTIAIYGIGGIGSCALLGAKNRGYNKIIAVDIKKNKLDHALELGATHVINSLEKNPVEAIKEITQGKGVDYAVESSAVGKVMESAYESLAAGGSLVIAGNAPKGTKIAIDTVGLNQGKKIFGTWGGYLSPNNVEPDKNIPRYEKMYHEGKLSLKKLITEVYNLNEINQAFDDLKEGRLCRALIRFDN